MRQTEVRKKRGLEFHIQLLIHPVAWSASEGDIVQVVSNKEISRATKPATR